MPSRVGVNLRASAYLHQGNRKYMEDEFVAAYQRTADKKDIEYAFFGIFDGHGGKEAAHFAKDHLMDNIVSQRLFWSDDDDDVLEAIREGFIQTHMAMWKVVETWPRTASGWPSTSGSTASVAFIRKQKIYIGHVGDSGICLGYEDSNGYWQGEHLTKEHKPESAKERSRINRCGGKVVNKSGVPRVVWNRPKRGHKGPVRRSTPMDEIPFLAVARSLGDLWSYNPTNNQFVVSPAPDVHVHPIDIARHRCLIFGTDGLWNVISPRLAVNIAYCSEKNNENHYLGIRMPCGTSRPWVNPSRSVVKGALDRYGRCNIRADNTSAVVVFLDPPGRPKREVLLQRKGIPAESIKDSEDEESGSRYKQEKEKADCKVQVHVYNLDNKLSKIPYPKAPHGILRIKERMPEKWQIDPASREVGASPGSSEFNTTPIRSIPGGPEQADTPGLEGSTPTSAGRHRVGQTEDGDPDGQSSVDGSAAAGDETATAGTTTCPPSLRSTLRSSLGDALSTPTVAASPGHNTRLSLCAAPLTPTSRRISSGHQRKATEAAAVVAAVGSCGSPTASRSLKRERDEESGNSSPCHKKTCTECGCGLMSPSKVTASPSLSLVGTREKSSSCVPVDKSSNIPSAGACTTCLSLPPSSPKSSKLKNAQDSIGKQSKKGDVIQSPVISSSSLLSSQQRMSSSPATAAPSVSTIPNTSHKFAGKLKLKKSKKPLPEYTSDLLAQHLGAASRTTRSGIPLNQSAVEQPENMSPNTVGGSSSSSSGGRSNHKPSLLSPASRVLKSVNHGGPSCRDNDGQNALLRSSQSTPSMNKAEKRDSSGNLKSFKYAAKLNRKRRSLSVPTLSSSGDGTTPPPKKSARMHLRSGKPMITRSQEKTCKK